MILADWYYFHMMKILFKKEEKMQHRFSIKDKPARDDVLYHELELQTQMDQVIVQCVTHCEIVAVFAFDKLQVVGDSCMRHGAVSIPFEIHHYKDVNNADKKE